MKPPRETINALAEAQLGRVVSNAWRPEVGGFIFADLTECGHTICCDSSPNQHASKHHVTPMTMKLSPVLSQESG